MIIYLELNKQKWAIIARKLQFFLNDPHNPLRQYLMAQTLSEKTFDKYKYFILRKLYFNSSILFLSQEQLTTIQEVNKLWQTHLQNLYTKNNNFYDSRQNLQNEINQLIVENQTFNSIIFERLQILQIDQNFKIRKETNEIYSSMINKQLYQMEQKEVEQVVQTLSQKDNLQEISQKQLWIQKEDQKYLEQIQEQLNLQRKKQLEISQIIDKLFYKKDFIKNLDEKQILIKQQQR